MYNKESITNVTIQMIIEEIKTFLTVGISKTIKPIILAFLKEDPSAILEVTKCMDAVLNAFDGLDSEYLREQYLKDNHFYVAPTKVIIGQEPRVEKNKQGKKEYTNVEVTGERLF